MNILLIFFALPIATIIISIALQKSLKCPPLVAAIIFAIFLIITFIIGDLNFLIATIVYTIISFITAVIVCMLSRFIRPLRGNNQDNNDYNCCSCTRRNLLTISSDGYNNINNELLTISSNNTNGNNCGCNNSKNNNCNYSANINQRRCSICGCFRR